MEWRISEYVEHSEGNYCFKKYIVVTHMCTQLPVWEDYFVLFFGFFVYMVKKKLRNTEYTTNNTWIWKQERPG